MSSVRPGESPLRLEHVRHAYGDVLVLDDLSLTVAPGEFVAIVGPSGCGKTTILNLLSGFLPPVSGDVIHRGEVRMVYQQSGLLPWQTVKENIALGLRRLPEAEQERQVGELVKLIGLEGFEAQYPHRLSGGMRQRVELARALAGETDILLLDEPFSALDYMTRLKMRRELARMLAERPRTVVLVTHDIEEASQLADRILVLSERPARIRCELSLSLERPRDPTHPQVVEATRRALAELGLSGAK